MNSAEQIASEISQRIQQLNAFHEDDLRNEMAALKQALKENPAACALLHDEDIGTMVSNLRRMLGTAVASAAAAKSKPKKEAKKKQMTAAELAAALDDEDF